MTETTVGPLGGLETKWLAFDRAATVDDGGAIEGYASLFGVADRSGDVVEAGAFARSLEALRAEGRRVKLLWQHDPAEPIGVWDLVQEDGDGLRVKGRLLTEVRRGAEALALLRAGAVDGLSIGYRAVRSSRRAEGGRLLTEVELWEVSLVTFPMLPEARAMAGAGRAEGAIDEHEEIDEGGEALAALSGALGEARRRFGA